MKIITEIRKTCTFNWWLPNNLEKLQKPKSCLKPNEYLT